MGCVGAATGTFYPVVHLLTGPPGLTRNGGVWKWTKAHMADAAATPRIMVQALHFTTYDLSLGAWDDWFEPYYDSTRLVRELDDVFGANRDFFIDSGGFQLLTSDKIDLSKWGLDVDPASILDLQLRYKPQRIASLDSPIGPKATGAAVSELQRRSIDNAIWLANESESFIDSTTPYLVVHGRTPDEIQNYVSKLEKELPSRWLERLDYGLALGSQVPLTSKPASIKANIDFLLTWMGTHCSPETPLHVFGVGESIIGNMDPGVATRPISFDNSTWVQKAFRMKMYDPEGPDYREFDPHEFPACLCWACGRLRDLGSEFLSDLMSRPAYRPATKAGEQVNRSDVMALVALHNMSHWEHRVHTAPIIEATATSHAPAAAKPSVEPDAALDYQFPLRQFEPEADYLLILPCTKGRPYKKSRTHRRVIAKLGEAGYHEGEDFDRITLSGLYGPVHWNHETHPTILSYDFPLTPLVSDAHKSKLKLRTANVLNVIRRKYDSSVAFLPSAAYHNVFAPVIESFGGRVAEDLATVPVAFSEVAG